MDFQKVIEENNATHTVSEEELQPLIVKAKEIHQESFDNTCWFERSIFTNWTCGIADCKYCFLSTKPKLDKNATRSNDSLIAEALLCKIMGWKIGYLTGGLRVESTEELITLLNEIEQAIGEKVMMNFGPYSYPIIKKLKPHTAGIGMAIESFDEDLHNFICPSKPLKALESSLTILKEENIPKLITIILGIGEKKEHVEEAIAKIKHYNIEKVQLCFLKAQQDTIFEKVPAPNMQYMAWWASQLRVAFPKLIIKVALVKDRIEEFHLLLNAGVNCFSRFLPFSDFNSHFTKTLEQECKKAGRNLQGNFSSVPEVNVEELISKLPFSEERKAIIEKKLLQYLNKLTRLHQEAPLVQIQSQS